MAVQAEPSSTGRRPAVHPRLSIRALLILLVAAATLPLLALLAYMSYALWADQAADATRTLKALAAQTAHNASIPIGAAQRITRFMAGRAALRALDPATCDPAFDDWLRQNRDFANIGTVDAEGNAVCTALKPGAPGRANIGNPAWLRRLKAERRFTIGAPQKGIYSGQWIAVTAHPILEDGKVIGAAQVMLKLATLGETVAAMTLPAEGVTGIISRDGVVIARSRDGAAWVGRDISATQTGRAVVEGRFDAAVLESSEGGARIYAFEPIAGTDWVAVAGLPTAVAFAQARETAWRNALAGALVLLLAALLARAVHRRIAVPLQALAEVARAVGAGDTRRRVAPDGPPELVDTATTFNAMLDRIPHIEARLRTSEQHYRSLFDTSPDAMRVVCEGHVVLANRAAQALYGAGSGASIVGTEGMATIHPDQQAQVRECFARVLGEGATAYNPDLTIVRADGSEVHAEVRLLPFEFEGRRAVLSTARDLTAQRAAALSIARLMAFKSVLSQVNQAIAQTGDWCTLCADVCRIIVETGHVVAAEIRVTDQERASLLPYAHHGAKAGRLGTDAIPFAETAHPAVLAFRGGAGRVIDDVLLEPALDDKHQAARTSGIRAALVQPLCQGGIAFGTLAVFAAPVGHFDADLRSLVAEVANNLAFAHEKLAVDRAFAQASARLAGVVDSAMDAIITVDASLRIVMFNRAAEAMLGIAAGAAIGASIRRFVPDDIGAGDADWWRGLAGASATAGSAAASRQIQALRADGAGFPADASFSHVEVDGETFHTVIMHDISGRVEAQREVAEAHARYQSLVENSASGVGLFEGFRFRFANPRLANMLGVADPRDLLDVDVIDFVPAEFQARVKESFRRRHADRRAELPPIRTRLSRRDGGVIDVEAIGTVIELDGRELLQAEIRDVTNELRALEEVRALNRDLEARVEQRTAALTETNRHLQRANADLESFGYTVAHDLRAPLRSMSGFATLMSLDIAEGNTADLVTHAGRIVGNAAKMNALIDGLLAVARAAHENMARKRVEMSTLVEEVLADTGARGRARVDVEALPAVEADPVAMRQIWVNLVSNALKYSAKRAQPAIAIGCVRSATEIAFHVRDNGCGFDPAYAQKLFGNFQRLHAGTEYEGTGIGLAIVRGLVERHGGRVWAEGAVDAGATFHFALLVERLA